MSYIRALREVWKFLVKTSSSAIEYTFLDTPDKEQFQKILLNLENSIEYLRMLFKNLDAYFFKFKCDKCQKEIYCRIFYNEIECENCRKKHILKDISKKEIKKIKIYPIDSIKKIHKAFDKIRDTMVFDKKEVIRAEIVRLWKRIRDTILIEFDRVVPTKVDSEYLTEKDIAFIKI